MKKTCSFVCVGLLSAFLVTGWYWSNERITVRGMGPLDMAKQVAAQYSPGGQFRMLAYLGKDGGRHRYLLTNKRDDELLFVELRSFFGGYQESHYYRISDVGWNAKEADVAGITSSDHIWSVMPKSLNR